MNRANVFLTGLMIIGALALLNMSVVAQDNGSVAERVSFISDHAELYAEEQEAQLNQLFEVLAIQEGLEIDLLTVTTLGGRSIAEYGDAIQEAWGIEQTGNLRRHLLILIVYFEGDEEGANIGEYSIVQSVGLQRYLPDSELVRINEELIKPELESGRSIEATIVLGIEEMIDSYLNAVEDETPVHRASGATGMKLSDFIGILTIVGGIGLLMLLNALLSGG